MEREDILHADDEVDMVDIKGRRIAMLATDRVEQVELTEPAKALRSAGARVDIISPKAGKIFRG